MNDELLKDYIKNVYTLEKSVYQQKKLSDTLSAMIVRLDKFEEEPYLPDDGKKTTIEEHFHLDKKKLALSIVLYPLGFGTAGALIMLITLLFEQVNILEYIEYIINFALIGAVVGIAYLIYSIIKKYREAVHDVDWINNRTKLINQLREMVNTRGRELIDGQIANLKQVIPQEQSRCSDTEEILKLYYDYNIISPEYRNLTAVSVFHEYFSSEKFDKSEGMNGAYAFYENELKHNNIPDMVESSDEDKHKYNYDCEDDDKDKYLDELKEKRPMMYAALYNGSDTYKAAKAMIKETEISVILVDKNSTVKAYREKIAAQNSALSEWIKTIRNKIA